MAETCIYSWSYCGTYHRCYIQRAAATSTLIWLHVILIQLHPILKPENNMVSIVNYKPKPSKVFFQMKKIAHAFLYHKKNRDKSCQAKEMYIIIAAAAAFINVQFALNATHLIYQLVCSILSQTHFKNIKVPFLCILVALFNMTQQSH